MELLRFPSHGGFSVRSILGFVLTVVITAFLWATLSSTPTHAETDAGWSSGTDTILYSNHGYNLNESFKDATGTIPSNATVYTAPVQTSDGGTSKRLLVIYFASGVDPPTATAAQYVEFDYSGNTTSNPQNARSLTLTPQGQENNYGSSCSVTGIGWILCPVSVFLADSMDTLFSILADFFIATQPLVLGDQNNSMYVAWNVMRTIANVAFVIVFIIIIYSQLTNLGVSNYGIKKLTPRLIIAAILVNLSFYIAAIAIDLSNIAGYSIQSIFTSIREGVFHLTNDDLSGFNTNAWGTVTAVILAGGGLIGGSFYVANTGLYLLIPLLIGLGLTILFVVLIFAARQAIIVILVIIAPIAFIANLLPNTEKWFDKWKDLFMTMLIFFPAFSLVFGGSQLAGQIIMQNANDNIVILLFGMAVQIAPLVITPLILKLSGGLLGRIAQIANNPRKGVLDRSRNWAQKRAEIARDDSIKQGPRARNLWGGGMVRGLDGRRRNLDNRLKAAQQNAENYYEENNKKYNDRTTKSGMYKPGLHTQLATASDNKERIHSHHAAHLDTLRKTKGNELHDAAMGAQEQKEYAEKSQNRLQSYYNNQRTLAGTALNASGTSLAASKKRLDTTQNRYNAYLAEQSATQGTRLYNDSVVNEKSKFTLNEAESTYAATVNAQKAAIGTSLHSAMIRAEQAKFTDEKTQAAMARVTKEYKSGAIDPTLLTPQLQTVMETMNRTASEVSAETQGGEAATYEIQRSISERMSGSGPLTDALLDTAQGVGGEAARTRAQAQAVSQKQKFDIDALEANVKLLRNEAATSTQKTIKRYSSGLIEAVLKGDQSYEGRDLTPERIKAALQAQADEKNMSLFEKVRGSTNFDQDLVSEVIALNVPTFKGAGGFHMQEDPNLNINNFASKAAFDQAMRASRIQSLANASASGLAGVKFGWIANLANDSSDPSTNIQSNIEAALAQPDGAKYLRMAYQNTKEALTNPDIRATIGDREDEIRQIEAALAAVFGQPPTPDDRPPLSQRGDTNQA